MKLVDVDLRLNKQSTANLKKLKINFKVNMLKRERKVCLHKDLN